MSGAGFMRIKKLVGAGIVGAAARHNRRQIQSELGAAGAIHADRMHLNGTLAGPDTADGVAELAKALMVQAGVGKLRKDAVRALEIVFSLPPGCQIDDSVYFRDCMAWVLSHYGGAVLSADVHRDESALHMHLLLLPLVEGRMVGSRMMGNRQKLAATHADFHAAVASHYGLNRAPARLAGASRQAAAAQVVTELKRTSDPALRSAAWSIVRENIESDPGPYLLALGIELVAAKKKPLKTMVQIFTGKGKGARKESKPIGFAPREELNPIGFEAWEKRQSLCSVGFAHQAPPAESPALASPTLAPATTPAPAALSSRTAAPVVITPPSTPEPAIVESVRVRDSEYTSDRYDPTTGDFVGRPAPRARLRVIAEHAVSLALAKRPRRMA